MSYGLNVRTGRTDRVYRLLVQQGEYKRTNAFTCILGSVNSSVNSHIYSSTR